MSTDLPTVLVIDDEAGLREMLQFGLPDRGYRVVSAENGERGIEAAASGHIELVITDIMMPGIGGVDVLKAIKVVQPKAEVIMATGFATLESAVESMKLGAYDYIAKPYTLDQLCQVLDKAREHRRLTAAVEHLEELHRLKSEFVAYMSHELRTPMNAILGYVSLTLEKEFGDISPAQEKALRCVENNSRSLLGIINNILDLSKLSADRMSLSFESCGLEEIIHDVLTTMGCLARDKHLSLSAEGSVPQPLRTDKAKLRQVLINLVGNAIKFTQRGTVTVKVESLAQRSQVRLSVQDTGIGIKPADIPHLFEEFRQLNNGLKQPCGGTGLGLAISMKIVQLLGGDLEVQSSPGQGSTFSVTLPVESQCVGVSR